MKLGIFTYLSLLSFSAMAPLCSFSEPPPLEVRIGVIQSLTGIAAEYGKTNVQSIQMAADEINSSGSGKVTLFIEDDRTESKDAVSAFQKLSTQRVDAIIGASWDFTTNAILPLSGRNKVVLFNTSTIKESLELSSSNGYGFTNGFLASEEVKPFERFLKKTTTKKAVIVYANNSWGEIQRAAYRSALQAEKVEIADELKPSSYDQNEWGSMIPRVRSKNADLILLLINRNDLEVFLRKAREQGLESRYFASSNGYDALKLATDKNLFEGICFSYPLQQLGKAKSFSENYKRLYGEPPRIYADATYDSVKLLVEAAKRAKSKGISMKTALETTSFHGIVGEYTFSHSNSFCIQQDSLVCVKNQSFVIAED